MRSKSRGKRGRGGPGSKINGRGKSRKQQKRHAKREARSGNKKKRSGAPGIGERPLGY